VENVPALIILLVSHYMVLQPSHTSPLENFGLVNGNLERSVFNAPFKKS
jgi:hypothetical protein